MKLIVKKKRCLSQKRSFSLIEVMVSFFLFTLLLGSLFFWYRGSLTRQEDLKKIKWTLQEEYFCHTRLQNILPKATLSKNSDEDITIFASSGGNHKESGGIVFTFDNGPFETPSLSNTVLGKLYLDKENHTLILGIWPIPNKGKEPHLVLPLLTHVKEINFSFFHAPDHFTQTISTEKIFTPQPKDLWQEKWNPKFQELPTIVKLTITREEIKPLAERKITYLFDLGEPIILPFEKKI